MKSKFNFIGNDNKEWTCIINNKKDITIIKFVTSKYNVWVCAVDDYSTYIYKLLKEVLPDYNFTKDNSDENIVISYELLENKLKMTININIIYHKKIIRNEKKELIFIENEIDLTEKNSFKIDRLEKKLRQNKQLISLINKYNEDKDKLKVVWVNLENYLTEQYIKKSCELSAEIKDNRVFLNGHIKIEYKYQTNNPKILKLPCCLCPKDPKYLPITIVYDKIYKSMPIESTDIRPYTNTIYINGDGDVYIHYYSGFNLRNDIIISLDGINYSIKK